MERNVESTPDETNSVERFTLIAAAVYFALRVIVRPLLSDTPEIDEGEQLLQSQSWQWGYGPQPPLYSWLQMLLFDVFGRNIFALALLKNLLLFATCALACAAGRTLSGSRRTGVAALLLLCFVPQFIWYSQNDLTHSVLAQFCTAALLLVILRLLRQKSTAGYLLVGVIMAAGVLSKYNFLVLLLAVLGALLSWPAGRRLLCDWRTGLSIFIPLLLVAPHLDWVRHHPDLAFSKVGNLQVPVLPNVFLMWGRAFLQLLAATLPYLLPVAAAGIYVLGRWPNRADISRSGPRPDGEIFLGRILLGTVLFALIVIFTVHANFDERWFQQNMFALPLLAAVLLQPHLDARRIRRLGVAAGFVAVVVFSVLAGRVCLLGATHAVQKQNLPLAELAGQLRAAGVEPQTILVEYFNPLGGAMLLAFPSATVLEPNQVPLPAHGNVLVVWRADVRSGNTNALLRLATKVGIADLPFNQAKFIEAPYKYWPGKSYRIGYLMLPETVAAK